MKKEYWLATYTIFCWGTLPAVTKLTLTSISNMQVLFISSREFNTLKLKKVSPSLETGLFFCQLFCFII